MVYFITSFFNSKSPKALVTAKDPETLPLITIPFASLKKIN